MKHTPSLLLSCVPLVVLVALVGSVVSVFGQDSLSGASQVALLMASFLCNSIGLWGKWMTWDDFEKALSEKVSGVSSALFILLFIGALGGAWMLSGVVPTLIYYGLEFLSPRWLLVASCLMCALVSVVTGSSWTTVATIGVALIGIGQTMGISSGWMAGAIISGAYFGDKMSPLSDTTVLASSTVGTPLFTHIRYMVYTTLPSMIVALLVFLWVGMGYTSMEATQVQLVQQALQNTFLISPWLFLIPVLTVLLIVRRQPPLVVLFLAVLMGVVAALLFQGELVGTVGGNGSDALFRGTFTLVFGSTALDTGVEQLNELVSTSGMAGMLDTIWLILCAMFFGASMTASRMLESLMLGFVRLVKGTASLVGSTVLSGLFLNVVCADQYLSIILSASMFKDMYQQKGYEPRLLSRTCEDSITVTSVLIPWNTCGMTQSSVLGVSTFVYAPYCIFCWMSPLVSFLVACLGWKIVRRSA